MVSSVEWPGGAGAEQSALRLEVVESVDERWDAITGTFADRCLEQMAAYMLPRWGRSRLRGLRLRDAASGETVAQTLVVLATLPIIELGLAYVKFGPLWRRKTAAADGATLAAAIASVKRVFAVERGLVVRIMPPPDPDHEPGWQRCLADAGFATMGPPPDPKRYLVDLGLTESEQLASLGTNWRRNLKKAEHVAFDIREVDPQQALGELLALYGDMWSRKQFSDRHNIQLLPALVGASKLQPELGVRLFLAYHDRQPVSGMLLVGSGERAFVAVGASNEQGRLLRAGYALHWSVMHSLRGSSTRWLDLGGTEGNDGLEKFKLDLVGKRGRVVSIAGEYDFAPNALSSIVSSAITSARGLMQAWPAGRKQA
jgi:hypothetical protein